VEPKKSLDPILQVWSLMFQVGIQMHIMNGDQEPGHLDLEIPRLSTIRNPGGNGLSHYFRLRLRKELFNYLSFDEDASGREVNVQPDDLQLEDLVVEPGRVLIAYSYVYDVYYGCSDIDPMGQGSGRLEGVRLGKSRHWRFARAPREAPC